MAEDFLKDEDLLSILEDSIKEDNKSKEKRVKKEIIDVEDKKDDSDKMSVVENLMSRSEDTKSVETAVTVQDLNDIADSFDIDSRKGSGDLDTDLSNWFDGVDTLPSDELTDEVSNSVIKVDFGLTHNTLNSFKLMAKLRKFIEEDAFDLLFSENAILGIDSEEVLERVKTAFTMYKELARYTQSVAQSVKDFSIRNDNKDSTDVDKLTLLLGSISKDKLQSILSEIAYNKKEDNYKSNS